MLVELQLTAAATGVVLPCSTSVKVAVVSVLASMASEKVTSTLVATATSVASAGGATLSTTGAVVSTVQLRSAGVVSALPAASVARTWKV